MNYDLGILSPAEAIFLKDSPNGIPENWINCNKTSVKIIPLAHGKKAGFIILPYLEKESKGLSQELIVELTELFKKFKNKTDILIGISSWGYFKEKKLLASPVFAEAPLDILLGSGDGPGMTGAVDDNGKTLWVRSYPTGKAVNRIDIFQWPSRDADFKWTSGQNIRWFLQSLRKNNRQEPTVLKLIEGISDDK
ncbi:hypothetical protein [Maridesulfovibrio ferrireducens]|uniref:UshA-like (seleno)protein family 2 n=1 Tax=Maridesulfovibrio ferrireducens TaxID=246191 RepID=UPI0026F0E5C8|nr:hypothetical protein [Maridesulfovibrio ferrireducens]